MPKSLVSSSPSDLVLIPYDEHFSVPGVVGTNRRQVEPKNNPNKEWKPKVTASTTSQISLASKTKVVVSSIERLGPSNPLSAYQYSDQVVDVTTEEQSTRAEFNESRNECTMPIDVVTDKPNPVFEQP
ncbi:hypothetical protein ACFE04_003491 [Oxalis oulophora]